MGKEPVSVVLVSMKQLADPAPMPAMGVDAVRFVRSIADWVSSYLMRSHPELGRPGEVCPFTARAYQLDTIRIGVSFAGSGDVAAIAKNMHESLQQFLAI